MSRATADLPDDVETLRAIIADQAERLQSRDTLIEKLKAQLAVLRRARFGVSSEKIERTIAQLELALEDIEAAAAETAPPILPAREDAPKTKPARQPLPIICRAMRWCMRPATVLAQPVAAATS